MKGNHLCSERNMLTLSLLGSTLRPVISSVIITPRLYTSAIFEGLPPLSYSGAQYPLHEDTAHVCIYALCIIRLVCVLHASEDNRFSRKLMAYRVK